MKRQIFASWILLLFQVPCFSLPGLAQDGQDMQKSCGKFVQSFYDWYVKQPDSSRALKYRPSAFSPELSRALKEDDEAQAKEPGYIVGLDWDPILSGNDAPPGERYVVDRIELKGDGDCWAEMHREWHGEKSKVLVAAELANNAGQWQFVNFYYVFPKSDLSTSVTHGGLLTILKNLREAREKAAKAQPMTQPQGSLPPSRPLPAIKPTPRN